MKDSKGLPPNSQATLHVLTVLGNSGEASRSSENLGPQRFSEVSPVVVARGSETSSKLPKDCGRCPTDRSARRSPASGASEAQLVLLWFLSLPVFALRLGRLRTLQGICSSSSITSRITSPPFPALISTILKLVGIHAVQ